MWNHISIIRKIKSKIPLELKLVLIKILFYTQNIWYTIFPKNIKKDNEKKHIYFLLSTDYANLGDHAMSYASLCFFKKNFPDYNVIEITVNDTLKSLVSIKKNINSKDLICLKGGGNIGIEYFREELIRRKIIRTFQNKIIIFPQTVFFPNTVIGKKEYNNTLKTYNAHPKLYTFLRDINSFEVCKNKLHNIYLVPDIVFSLEKKDLFFKEEITPKHISICMRNDVEGIYNDKFKENLKNELIKKYGVVKEFDTIKPYYISIKNRNEELKKIINEIKYSKVIITDRLHGMILAYLLDVPCVVMRTYNYKLIGQYNWLKKCNYIKKAENDNIDEILECIDSILYDFQRKHINFENKFEIIAEVMRK